MLKLILKYWSIYFGACSFLIGMLLSALVNTILAKDRDKQIRKIIARTEAGRELSAAFIMVRDLLEIKPPTNPAIGNEWQKTYKLLQRFYKEHRAAVRKFEDILSDKEKPSFRDCWDTYCCYDKNTNEATFLEYQSETAEEEFNKRHLASSRIKELLDYTQIK